MNIVIDTNVFISALIKDGSIARKIAKNSGWTFLFPEFEFQEIYKHKDELLRKSGLSERSFIQAASFLLKYMRIIRFFEICDYLKEAQTIMGKIDPDDSIFIATALAFNCPIWSDDKHFKKQDKIRIFTTKELFELVKN